MGYIEDIKQRKARKEEAQTALSIEPKRGALNWTFDQLWRTTHGSLGAIKAGVEGKPASEILAAGKRGLLLQERTFGSDPQGRGDVNLEKAIADWGMRNPRAYQGFRSNPFGSVVLPPPTDPKPEQFETDTALSRLLSHKRDTKGQLRGVRASRHLEEGYAAAKGFGEGLASASRGLLYEIGLDPLTYVPIVGPAKAVKRALTPAAEAMKLPQAFQKVKGTKLVDELGKAFKPFFGMGDTQKRSMRKYLWGKEAKKKEFEEGIKDVFKGAKLTDPQAELASAGIIYPELMKGVDDPVKAIDDLLTAKGAEGTQMRQREFTLEAILGAKVDDAQKALKKTEKQIKTIQDAPKQTARGAARLEKLTEQKNQIEQLLELAGTKQQRAVWKDELAELGGKLEEHKGLFETPEKELRGIAESLAKETPEARAGIAEASKFGRKTLDEMLEREKPVLGTATRDRYFPGTYPKEVKRRGGAFTAGKTFVSPIEAKAAGYEPEMNMWAVIAERGRKSIDKVETRLFTEDMLARYGTKIDSEDQLKAAMRGGERIWAQRQKSRTTPVTDIPDWVESRIAKISDQHGLAEVRLRPEDIKSLSKLSKDTPLYTMPEPLVHWMNNYEKRMGDGTIQTIARWNSRYMNYFRGYATMPRMAFHLRNTVDNYFRLFLDIGPQALNPRWNVNAAKVLFKGTKGKIKLHGKEYSFDQIRKLMEEHGLRRHGWLGADTWSPDLPQNINKMFEGHGKKLARAANPFSVEDFGLLKAGRWLGSNIEDHAHAVSFLKNLDKTGDPYKAAMRAHKFLFDYRELTPFERRAGKGLMPFYTFFRKNVPFQAEQILTQPGKYAMVPKGKRFIENLSEEPEYTPPEYMAKSYSVRLPIVRTEKDAETGKVRTYDQYANMSMSFQELNQLSTMGDLISRLHPGLKMIAEKFAEKEAFSDIPGGLSEGRLAKLGDGVALLPENVREKLGIKRYRQIDGTTAWKMPSRTLYDLRMINPLIPETLKYLKEDKFSKLNIDWKRLTTGALTTELDPETQKIYNRFAIGEKKRAYIKQKRQEMREVKP